MVRKSTSFTPPTLVPRPKNLIWFEDSHVIQPGSVAIVLGQNASDPERYAAETLQTNLKRRFKLDVPVLSESESLGQLNTLIIMGMQSTNPILKQSLSKWDMDTNLPSDEGYVIRMGALEGKFIIAVSGGSPRGVVYGGDTLFQLFADVDGQLSIYQAEIKDWPSIPHRGWPLTANESYFTGGFFDAVVRARMNYIDIRDGHKGGSRGQFGYPPGYPIDVDECRKTAAEAHKRGLFVYAAVNCAIPEYEFEAAERTFEELLDAGADGICISIDDPGAEWRYGTPMEMVHRALAIAKKHNLKGPQISIVPGKESYKQILTDVNRRVAQIPELKEAIWYFTRVPSETDLESARSIGMKSKPGWWHNWPRPTAGFNHSAYGGGSFRKDRKPPYMDPPPLTRGWGEPSYENLADAAKYVDCAMIWGGGSWGHDYVGCPMGWWAWSPETHNWKHTADRIYDTVFGPELIDTVRAFDGRLEQLRDLFDLPMRNPKPSEKWPPKLKDVNNRPWARRLVKEMEKPLAKLESEASKLTLLPDSVLKEYYLDAARSAMEVARDAVEAHYPEYWWPKHEERIVASVETGDLESAKQFEAMALKRIDAEMEELKDKMGDVLGIDDYISYWQNRIVYPAEAKMASRAPVIKGDLSDPVWQEANVFDSFGVMKSGKSPKDQTEVRLLYTEDALYVGFTCFESTMDDLSAKQSERDSVLSEDDSIEIIVDPQAFRDTYFQIAANPNGVVFDGRKLQGDEFDATWDADVDVRTGRAPDRWTAEFRISLKSLGINECPKGRILLFNFTRCDRAGNPVSIMGDSYEISYWSPSGGSHDTNGLREVRFV